MDAAQPHPPPQDAGVGAAAKDELVRSLVAAAISVAAGLALLWLMSHTADVARAAAWTRARVTVPEPAGPPPEYWAFLPGLHRDMRKMERGTMSTNQEAVSE